MPSGRVMGALAALIGFVLLSSCSKSDSRREALPPEAGPTRSAPKWTVLWRIGGTEADTTLLQPLRLALSERAILVLDGGRRAVSAFDRATGAAQWTFGRPGSGPGELRLPQAAASLRNGQVAIFDAGNRRLVLVNDAGEAVANISMSGVGSLHSFCELRRGEFLGLIAAPSDPIVRFDMRGTLLGREPLPWPDLAALAPVAQTVQFARGTSEGCAMMAQAAPTWGVRTSAGWSAAFSYTSASPRASAEVPVDVGSAVSMPDDSTVMISTLPAEGQVGAALRRFGRDGTAHDDWVLPTPPVNRIVWQEAVADTVFVLHGMNGVPTLSAFVRTHER